MRFNESKTKLLRISNKRTPTDINLSMNETRLSLVPHHKHLGITFDQNGSWNTHISDIVVRASRKVGILRNLKYKLNRKSIEMLYKSVVRPIFDYCDVVWDCLPAYLNNRIESIQIDSLRIISGVSVSCSKQKLYTETGFRPLSERRKIHRLIMFYKIINGLTPGFLYDLIPHRHQDLHGYATRNRDNYVHFLCSTEAFSKTFYPQTLRDWEALPDEIKNQPTVNLFKTNINRFFSVPIIPVWYYVGQRTSNIHLCKLRNKCSSLNHHLLLNHITDDQFLSAT